MLTGCESELRCEIPLPPSDITRFGFPDVFPSPPEEISAPRDKHSDPSQFPESEHGVEVEVERSWFYYLAEISFRKMMNRAISTLCRGGELSWVNNIHENIKQCEAFENDINLW